MVEQIDGHTQAEHGAPTRKFLAGEYRFQGPSAVITVNPE